MHTLNFHDNKSLILKSGPSRNRTRGSHKVTLTISSAGTTLKKIDGLYQGVCKLIRVLGLGTAVRVQLGPESLKQRQYSNIRLKDVYKYSF